MPVLRVVVVFLLVVLPTRVPAEVDMAEGWADVFVLESERGAPLPVLSEYVPDFDIDYAYAVQRALVRQQLPQRGLAGYRAAFGTVYNGVADAAAPQRLSAVLFADGARRQRAVFRVGKHRQLEIGTEFGFVLRSPIRRAMKSADDLKTYVAHFVPVVTMTDATLAAAGSPTRLDEVAVNLGRTQWLGGREYTLDQLQPGSDQRVEIYRGDEILRSVEVDSAALLETLLWLVNHLHERNWPLAAGHMLVVGAADAHQAVAPGRFRVDFAAFGDLSFVITSKRGQNRRSRVD